MICIGLDLATKRTGCCVLKDGNLVHYECIRANKKDDFRTRIRYISGKIESIINEFLPDKIFIEDAPIIKNSSASMLCITQGYFLCLADKYNVEIREDDIFQPSSWRKTLGIAGEDVKQATVDYVNNRFNLNLIYKKDSVKSEDDIADSIGIACCGIARSQNGERNV